jgi:sugar phosphate isomerase/epimerase
MDKVKPLASRLALGWLTLPNATPLQLITAAALGGFSSVGMRIARRPTDNAQPIIGNEELIQDIEHSLNANDVTMLHMGGIWLDGTQPVAAFEPAFETGARLGARMCVAIATPDLQPSQLLDDFSELCERANRHGIRVAIEFARYTGIKRIEDANVLIDRSGQQNAGILIDALHLYRSGGSAQSVAEIPAGRIYCAQLCDAVSVAPEPAALQTEARGNRLDPGQGDLPLADFMHALPPGIPIELEAPCLAYRNIDHVERAKIAGATVRAFLNDIGK